MGRRKVKGEGNATGHLRRAAERSLNELLIDCRGEGGPKARLVTQHANLFFCTIAWPLELCFLEVRRTTFVEDSLNEEIIFNAIN